MDVLKDSKMYKIQFPHRIRLSKMIILFSIGQKSSHSDSKNTSKLTSDDQSYTFIIWFEKKYSVQLRQPFYAKNIVKIDQITFKKKQKSRIIFHIKITLLKISFILKKKQRKKSQNFHSASLLALVTKNSSKMTNL